MILGGYILQNSDIKGILFDKDGTIIDFYTLWLPVVERVAENIIEQLTELEIKADKEKSAALNDNMMDIFGVCTEKEKIDPEGNLAQATVMSCARELADYLAASDVLLKRDENELVDEIIDIMEASAGGIEFTENLRETADLDFIFSELKNRGFYVGLATADSRPSTLTSLQELKLMDYFDYIACGDDDKPDKPDPTVVENFCDKFGLSPGEVAYVGDTPVDMQTASNAGVGLIAGVLCGVGQEDDLQNKADVIIENPSKILDILNGRSGQS